VARTRGGRGPALEGCLVVGGMAATLVRRLFQACRLQGYERETTWMRASSGGVPLGARAASFEPTEGLHFWSGAHCDVMRPVECALRLPRRV
jgi:hypothetical protein